VDNELRKALVFSILMETDGNVLTKSPDYIEEKWKAVKTLEDCEILLDWKNQKKLKEYIKKWHGESAANQADAEKTKE
jgi:hypothetical protein